MFPPFLKVKGNGRVISEGWESPFGSVVNVLVSCASGSELREFIGSEFGVIVDDVKVRLLCVSDSGVFVVLSPSD